MPKVRCEILRSRSVGSAPIIAQAISTKINKGGDVLTSASPHNLNRRATFRFADRYSYMRRGLYRMPFAIWSSRT